MSSSTDPCDSPFARDVLEGLSQPKKFVPSRWLYDQRGSELFEEITGLEEYYPTRTETSIFHEQADEIGDAVGPGAVLVEYGAGALVKTRILLDALQRPAGYVPIDISGPFLREAAGMLRQEYPDLAIEPVVGDFTKTIDLSSAPGEADRRVGFFPGSTLGNLTDPQIVDFFLAARESLGPQARFILGVDLKKDPAILIPAYDDARGVTSEFILNILTRMNRELGAEFEPDHFSYRATWNAADSQIEMYVVADTAMQVQVCGRDFNFEAGEAIRTSFSRKFDFATLDPVLSRAGWRRERTWTDEKNYFAVMLLGAELA